MRSELRPPDSRLAATACFARWRPGGVRRRLRGGVGDTTEAARVVSEPATTCRVPFTSSKPSGKMAARPTDTVGYTSEQREVIESRGPLRVDAVAGSGKTQTLLGYAGARPSQRILYLAFNRSVRQEAVRKFRLSGHRHVTVATLHSLAYQALEVGRRYALLETGNLRIHDVVQLCSLSPKPGREELVLAGHVKRLLERFWNGAEGKVGDVDYLSLVEGHDARAFARAHLADIQGHAARLFGRMARAEVPLTHDAYLKLYQLRAPRLSHDVLLLDEAQDASPVMLQLLAGQKGDLVAVGDSQQGLYRFRHAVNALETLDFPRRTLSRSFRFGPEIAELAAEALAFKKLIGCYPPGFRIDGAGEGTRRDVTGVIARTNLRLLDRAIDISILGGEHRIHFEGELKSYTYLRDGGSLYDVLALLAKRPDSVRDPFLREFRTLEDLTEYLDQVEDRELELVLDIVKKYGTSLYALLRQLRQFEVSRDEAKIIFSTVHKAKGQEFPVVKICDDFASFAAVKRFAEGCDKRSPRHGRGSLRDTAAVNEEINMLYTAITRAQTDVLVPAVLFEPEEEKEVPHEPLSTSV